LRTIEFEKASDAMELMKKFTLPADQHTMNEAVAAEFMGSSPRTLQRWRGTGEGPPYHRLGKRKVVYFRSELLAWLAGRRHTSTSAEGYRRSNKTA
jgi:predicted DNA-binding transcriptional regulator AlpA